MRNATAQYEFFFFWNKIICAHTQHTHNNWSTKHSLSTLQSSHWNAEIITVHQFKMICIDTFVGSFRWTWMNFNKTKIKTTKKTNQTTIYAHTHTHTPTNTETGHSVWCQRYTLSLTEQCFNDFLFLLSGGISKLKYHKNKYTHARTTRREGMIHQRSHEKKNSIREILETNRNATKTIWGKRSTAETINTNETWHFDGFINCYAWNTVNRSKVLCAERLFKHPDIACERWRMEIIRLRLNVWTKVEMLVNGRFSPNELPSIYTQIFSESFDRTVEMPKLYSHSSASPNWLIE